MTHVSRPLIALLLATVLLFALWTVALKPHSSSGGGASQGLGASQSAINKAHQLQGVVNRAGASDGGTPVSTPHTATTATSSAHPSATTPQTSTAPAHTAPPSAPPSTTSAHASAPVAPATIGSAAGAGSVIGQISPAPAGLTATQGFHLVQTSLEQHKVLALLFYNPASPDDRAVDHELSSIPTHGGEVVKLAVPLQQLSAYSALLNQVPVNYSPTLVLIDRTGQAEEIAGYADPFEIDQRVAGALGSSPPKG